jgi:hypothetical protein
MRFIVGLCAAVFAADYDTAPDRAGRSTEKHSIVAGKHFPVVLAKGDPPPSDENDKKIVSRSKRPKHPKPPKDHKPPDKDDPDHDSVCLLPPPILLSLVRDRWRGPQSATPARSSSSSST